MAKIEAAVAADHASIDRLAQLLYGEGVRRYVPVRQASRTFVARQDDEVVGFVICTFSDYGVTRSGQIDELAVAQEARGGGTGRDLVRACQDWLKSEGIEVIFVSVLGGAETFYARLGFEPCIGPWFYFDLTKTAP